MKKFLFYTFFCLLIFTTGCKSNINITNDSSKSTEPEYLYRENPNIDMFVYQDIAFVNASDIACATSGLGSEQIIRVGWFLTTTSFMSTALGFPFRSYITSPTPTFAFVLITTRCLASVISEGGPKSSSRVSV